MPVKANGDPEQTPGTLKSDAANTIKVEEKYAQLGAKLILPGAVPQPACNHNPSYCI
jgi:hypothetical protein